MALMKAMKSILKKRALGKAKALAKGKASKSNLEKLGELTLADKIKAAAKLRRLQQLFLRRVSPDENSQVWGRHQTQS